MTIRNHYFLHTFGGGGGGGDLHAVEEKGEDLDAVEDKEHAIKNSYHFCLDYRLLGYKLCRSVIPRGVNKEYGFWVSVIDYKIIIQTNIFITACTTLSTLIRS